ncbi:hypothetical protein Tco_0231362 [Tanacetum coccineum]
MVGLSISGVTLGAQWPSGWCSRHDRKRFELEAIYQDHDEGLLGVIVLPGGKNYARKRVVRSSQVEMDPAESEPSKAPHTPEHAPLSPAYASDSPEYAPPSDDDLEPAEAQALPARADPEDVSKEEPSKETDPDEEELLTHVTSTPAVPDPTLPSKEETEPFQEDEVAPTPPSPTSPSVTPLSHIRLHRVRKSVRPHQLLSPSTLADTTTLLNFPLYLIGLRAERALQSLLLDSLGLLWPKDNHEMYVRIQVAHDDRAALRARALHIRIVIAEQEVVYARDA